MIDIEMAETLLTPEALAPLHNAYYVYKGKGGNTAKVIKAKHKKTEAFRSELKNMSAGLAKEIKAEEAK